MATWCLSSSALFPRQILTPLDIALTSESEDKRWFRTWLARDENTRQRTRNSEKHGLNVSQRAAISCDDINFCCFSFNRVTLFLDSIRRVSTVSHAPARNTHHFCCQMAVGRVLHLGVGRDAVVFCRVQARTRCGAGDSPLAVPKNA